MSIEFNEDLSRSVRSLKEYAKIMTALQTYNPPIEDETVYDYLVISGDIDEGVMTSFIEDATTFSEIMENADPDMPYWFRTPSQPYAYPLTHTDFGSLTFPKTGKKWAGNCLNDGTGYIKTDHEPSYSWTDMGTAAFALAGWHKKTSTGTYGIICKRNIATTINAGFNIYFTSTNIECRISDGTNTALLSGTLAGLNDDSWHSWVVNVPASGNLELFIDNSSVATVARGSVANLNNTRDTYHFAQDNAGTPQDIFIGNASNWLWKKGEIFDATQRTDWHTNGVFDLTSAQTTECIYFPFWDSTRAQPNATPGRFSV